MSKKKRILPFGTLPTHWGGTDEQKQKKKLEYYYSGIDLEKGIADIDFKHNDKERRLKHLYIDWKYGNIDNYTYNLNKIDIEYGEVKDLSKTLKKERDFKVLKLDYDYGYIDENEFEERKVDLDYDDEKEEEKVQKELKKLKVRYNRGEISKIEYEKQRHTILDKPWIHSESVYDPDQGISGYAVEYDYNDKFIEMLKDNGYTGETDDEIINQYVNDICLSVAKEEGLLDELFPEDEINDMYTQEQHMGDDTGPIKSSKIDDGLTKYS